jgi:hypothetical protein
VGVSETPAERWSNEDRTTPEAPVVGIGVRLAPAATAVGVALARWWFAADRRVFHVTADEPGQLAMARWLSGGTRWNMFDHSTWRPGYAVLLAPLFRVFDSGEQVVRAALVLNAILGGLSAVLLAGLLRRWTRSWEHAPGEGSVCVIAAVVALSPAAIGSSAYTWAESLVTATFLATVWWTQRFVDARRVRDGLLAVASATVAMTSHGRSLALLPTVAVLVVALLAHGGRRRAALGVGTAAVALGAASLWFTDFVQRAVWDDPGGTNTPGSVVSRLDAPIDLVDSFVGQTWYQLVASFGLIGVGGALVLGALVRPAGRTDRAAAATLVLLTGPLILTSVTFMAGRDRADQLVYGRYVDAVVWPLAALGLAVLVRSVRHCGATGTWSLAGVAALTLATGLVVDGRHGEALADDVGLRMMVPGLLPFLGDRDAVAVLRITTIVALGCLATSLALRHLPRPAPTARRTVAWSATAAIVAATALAWAAGRVHDAEALSLNRWDISDQIALAEQILPDGEPIGVVMVPDTEQTAATWSVQRQRYQVYQLYLDEHPFRREPDEPTQRFVFAPLDHTGLRSEGATVVWRDPAVPIGLWARR